MRQKVPSAILGGLCGLGLSVLIFASGYKEVFKTEPSLGLFFTGLIIFVIAGILLGLKLEEIYNTGANATRFLNENFISKHLRWVSYENVRKEGDSYVYTINRSKSLSYSMVGLIVIVAAAYYLYSPLREIIAYTVIILLCIGQLTFYLNNRRAVSKKIVNLKNGKKEIWLQFPKI